MKLCSLFLFLLFAAPIGAQKNLQEADLSINGVRVGTTYAKVISAFGKPLTSELDREESDLSCTASEQTYLRLNYDGLTFVLMGNGRGRSYRVIEIDVTKPRWDASGIRIGAGEKQVTRRFGRPVSRHTSNGIGNLHYVTRGNFGGVNFEFDNGRLSRILVSETIC